MEPSSSSSLNSETLDLPTLKRLIRQKGPTTAAKLHLLTKVPELRSYKFLQDFHDYVSSSQVCEFMDDGGVNFSKKKEFKRLLDGYKNKAGEIVPPDAGVRELLGNCTHKSFIDKIKGYNLKRVVNTNSFVNEHFTRQDPDLVHMVLYKQHRNESVVKSEQRSKALASVATAPVASINTLSSTEVPADVASSLNNIVSEEIPPRSAVPAPSAATPPITTIDTPSSTEESVDAVSLLTNIVPKEIPPRSAVPAPSIINSDADNTRTESSQFTAPSTEKEPSSSVGAIGPPVNHISLLFDQLDSIKKNVLNSKAENQQMEEKLRSMEELVTQLVTNVAGPSVGLSEKWMPQVLLRMLDKGIGVWAPLLDFKRAVIDLSCTSVGYEMKAGDMRLAVTGDTLARLMEFSNINVVRRSRLMDCVTKSGRLIMSMFELFPGWETAEEKKLGEFFDSPGFDLDSENKFINDDKFREKTEEALDLLASGDDYHKKAWSTICDFYLRRFQNFYELLGMTVEQRVSSYYVPDVIPFVDKLSVEEKLETLEDGSVAIKAEGTAIPLVVIEGDGDHNLCVIDLVSLGHYLKFDKADRTVYVSGVDHSDYFAAFIPAVKSLRCLAASRKQLHHVSSGLVLGEDGKESNIHFSDWIFPVMKQCHATLDKEGETQHWSCKQLKKYVEDLGLAAVRYAFLKQDSTANFTSSIEEMLNDKGDTAIALQHARGRICLSIEKAGLSEHQIQQLKLDGRMVLDSAEERELARRLLDFQEVVQNACTMLKPNLVCNYLCSLSACASAVCDIVRTEDSNSRLVLLLLATRTVMDETFALLGMNTMPSSVDQQQ